MAQAMKDSDASFQLSVVEAQRERKARLMGLLLLHRLHHHGRLNRTLSCQPFALVRSGDPLRNRIARRLLRGLLLPFRSSAHWRWSFARWPDLAIVDRGAVPSASRALCMCICTDLN